MLEPLDRYRALRLELARVRGEGGFARIDERQVTQKEDEILSVMDQVWWSMSDKEREEIDNGWDCCRGSLNHMARRISEVVRSKGFETTWRNVPEKLMLVVTELAEAMEWYRNFSGDDLLELGRNPEELASERGNDSLVQFRFEIADAVIRLLNLSASLGIDIEAAIAAKMERNEKRPFRHGGKNC